MRTKLRSKVTLLFMTFAVLLTIPAVALADNAVADGDGAVAFNDSNMAMGSVCSGVESSKTAPVKITRQGNATATNTFANGATVTVTASVTGAGLSAEMASPNTITLPSNWATVGNGALSESVSSTVKVNSSVAGPGSGTVTYSAKGLNSSGATITRTDTMNVSWTTANCDTTAPVITSDVQGTLGNNGWYTSNVIVDWTVSDPESAISSQSGCNDFSVTSDQNSTTYTCTATSAGGTSSDSVTIKRDATAPVVNDDGTTQAPNGAGWFNTAVSNNFSSSDATSGLADSTQASFTKSSGTAEGSAVKINSGPVSDNAGNTNAGIDSAAFKIDLTNPMINGSASPAANTNGWNNSDVTVSFSCDDGLSGVASCSDSTTLSSEGANQSVTGNVTDAAGNTASDTVSNINIDKTAPVVTLGAVSGTAGTNGWYKSAVSQTFNASDALSGLPASFTTPFSVSSSGEGSAVEIKSGAVTDNADNTNNGISATFKIDLSDPYDVTFVGGPNAGGSYDYGTTPAAPTCTAKDAVSGMPDNGGCVVTDSNPGGFSATGSHTLTATATDNAGRTETATRSYTVAPYRLSGFYAPVDMGGVVNTVKGGSTVPLKFELFQSISGTELTDTSGITLTATKTNCAPGATEDAIEVTATGGTSLRYDSTGGQFIYNWKTPTGAGCYTVTMTAADGSKITAYFKSLK
jgi:hypothetical protein